MARDLEIIWVVLTMTDKGKIRPGDIMGILTQKIYELSSESGQTHFSSVWSISGPSLSSPCIFPSPMVHFYYTLEQTVLFLLRTLCVVGTTILSVIQLENSSQHQSHLLLSPTKMIQPIARFMVNLLMLTQPESLACLSLLVYSSTAMQDWREVTGSLLWLW